LMGSTETNQVKDAFITALEERMRAVAREVFADQAMQGQGAAHLTSDDHTALEIGKTLRAIRAKEFITIREAHVLLGCSDGHIRNLVDKARRGKTSYPIPFLDLDGVTVFPLAKLLEWAERPKLKKRAVS
jgi:hypothetical protein